MTPSVAKIGADHAPRSPACRAASRRIFPEGVGLDVRHRDLAFQVHGGGARSVPDTHRRVIHGGDELARQAGRHAVAQHLQFRVEQIDCAAAARNDPFDDLGHGLEHARQGGIGGDFLEDPSLAGGDGIRALALGDVGDAGADQPPVGTRQTHETHLARKIPSIRIAVHPLEHRCLALEGAVDVAARHAERRSAELPCRGDLLRTARQQRRPVHPEEAAGILVDVDEPAQVGVEYDDHLRRVLHEGSVARLAVADRLFGDAALRGVSNADDEAVAPAQARLADGDLHRDARPALAAAPGLERGQIHVGVVDLRSGAVQEPNQTARFPVAIRSSGVRVPGQGRQQVVELTAENLRGRVAEYALTRRIEALDVATVVDGDDGILDVVENGLQPPGRLLADLARESLGLVRHELHGQHDAAPLGIQAIVMGADRLQKGVDIQLAAAPARLVELPFERAIQARWALRWRAAKRCRFIA